MVQFKKSPLEPREPHLPTNLAPETDVWVMPMTGEAFTHYDDYLRKLEYYNQHMFTCEITGHGHLTYFDAVRSEKTGTLAMESAFPQALRKPVLDLVQNRTIPRLDDLVNHLYDAFKDNYHVGETLGFMTGDTGQRLSGVVKSKAVFASQNGRPPITRYFITLPQNPSDEEKTALMDSDHVFRERKSFTKQILRSFLRYAIEREPYDGAPWTVKDKFAEEHNIDTRVPRFLTQETITAMRKSQQSLSKSKIDIDRIVPQHAPDFEDMARQILEHKGKMPYELVMRYAQSYKALQYPDTVPTHPIAMPVRPGSTREAKIVSAAERPAPVPQAAPEPRYPREDFEVKPRQGVTARPTLRFQQQDALELDDLENLQPLTALSNASIGMALSVWSTLNIHSHYFIIDSFSYDDFIQAMLFTSTDAMPELFSEVHCAVLKALVDKEGKVEAQIPALSDSSSSADTSPDRSTTSTPPPEVAGTEPGSPGKITRSSSLLSEPDDSNMNGLSNGHVSNNVPALLGNYDWKARIKDRDFEYGGWQTIMAGLMHHLSQTGWVDDTPSKVTVAIAPSDEPASQETARLRYAELDVNLRLGALQAAVMLACTSKPFKDRMEERGLQQTTDRKDKTEAQRRRKPLIEELQNLDLQRKLQRPDELSEPVTNGHPEEDPMDVDDSEPDIGQEREEDSDSDSEPTRGRRRSGRASDLKRKHEQLERQREARIAELKQAVQSSERAAYEQILVDIEVKRAEIRECEEEVALVDGKLRENSCHRTRCLGVDRFCNRYWWFERNGMPFAGREESSTAGNGYVNGRLWVQGPGLLEREGYFDLSEADNAYYRALGGGTPSERRALEQGAASLKCETDWGYYATPEELDNLISCLDDRGRRERLLLKELIKWRDDIKATMTARAAYLEDLVERRRQAAEEPVAGVATRKKAHHEGNKVKYPCLGWSNNEAEKKMGHLHSESQARIKMRGVARPKGTGGFIAVNHIMTGKRETRRGTKY